MLSVRGRLCSYIDVAATPCIDRCKARSESTFQKGLASKKQYQGGPTVLHTTRFQDNKRLSVSVPHRYQIREVAQRRPALSTTKALQ